MSDPGGGNPRRSGTKPCQKDVGVQTKTVKKSSRFSSCMFYSMWSVAVVVGILATLPVWNTAMGFIENLVYRSEFVVGPALMEDLGMEGVVIFKQHDRNGDGVLSLDEFEPIAHRLLQVNETNDYDLPITEFDEVVTIQSYFTPLNLSTMSKAKEDSLSESGPLDSLHGVKYWKQPAKEWKNFAVDHLSPFLPDDPYLMESVGEVYYLIKPLDSSMDGPTLSSNRYIPPPLMGDQQIMIHRLLAMFSARPFVYTRFGPQGSVAIVRAYNEKYVDIMFRIHAEFQLNEPPFYPFWFTPAQFTGNLIMSKDGAKLISFNLYVPTHNRLNVDMEWLNGPKEQDNMEVDIGFMDRMELQATRSSIHVHSDGKDFTETYIPTENEDMVKNIVWKEQISQKNASGKMEVKMYPFKKVTYHNFTDAYQTARVENKLVHSIILWGSLEDQSC